MFTPTLTAYNAVKNIGPERKEVIENQLELFKRQDLYCHLCDQCVLQDDIIMHPNKNGQEVSYTGHYFWKMGNMHVFACFEFYGLEKYKGIEFLSDSGWVIITGFPYTDLLPDHYTQLQEHIRLLESYFINPDQWERSSPRKNTWHK